MASGIRGLAVGGHESSRRRRARPGLGGGRRAAARSFHWTISQIEPASVVRAALVDCGILAIPPIMSQFHRPLRAAGIVYWPFHSWGGLRRVRPEISRRLCRIGPTEIVHGMPTSAFAADAVQLDRRRLRELRHVEARPGRCTAEIEPLAGSAPPAPPMPTGPTMSGPASDASCVASASRPPRRCNPRTEMDVVGA